jgi:hypothetical protein
MPRKSSRRTPSPEAFFRQINLVSSDPAEDAEIDLSIPQPAR